MSSKMRRTAILAAVLALSGTALAVKKGDNLYIKAKNTRLMASSSPTASAVATLQPGDQVSWQGADPSNKLWHSVKAGGKAGFVFQTCLSATKPSGELVAKDGATSALDPHAFASSGAATKAFSESAEAYGGQRPELKEVVQQIKDMEALARGVSAADCAEHARQAGLFPVVGAR